MEQHSSAICLQYVINRFCYGKIRTDFLNTLKAGVFIYMTHFSITACLRNRCWIKHYILPASLVYPPLYNYFIMMAVMARVAIPANITT